MSRSSGYGDVVVTYIRRSEYPHIDTLSICTSKNQGTDVRCALYISTYEYNYKVITGCDTKLQEYYITDRGKCQNTKRYTNMNSTKDAHEWQKKNSRDEQRGLEEKGSGWFARDPRFQCTTLVSNRENSTSSKLQDLDIQEQARR